MTDKENARQKAIEAIVEVLDAWKDDGKSYVSETEFTSLAHEVLSRPELRDYYLEKEEK